MARNRDTQQGLVILGWYKPEGSVDAQHDVLYAEGPPPSEMRKEDVEQLDKMGWHWDDDIDSWRKFT